MAFMNENVKKARQTVIFLRTAVSMARSQNAYKDLDSRIEDLEGYLQNLHELRTTLGQEQGVESYLDSIEDMIGETSDMLEQAQKKKKKRKGSPYP